MSEFIVSARKYRPQRFEDVVGQQHVAGTLKNALATDHVAHAFLFTGPRGVGKTTCARILAKILNCQQRTPDNEACNTCASCRALNESASFNIIELDAASNNSVEHIRALIEQVRFRPQQGQYKVFIIDEVHMLSNQAFNAFLKTLEEPPPYAIFILATTEKHKIIPTILSRCQIFDFRRITVGDMVLHLKDICRKEGLQAEDEALHIIAQKADGALRDALSIFDRIAASASGGAITYNGVIENLNVLDYDYYFSMTDALLAEDLPVLMNLFDQILRKGFDPDIFILGLAEHLRNILVCKDKATLQLLETGDALRERYRRQADLTPASFLITALNLANDCDINFKMARQKRLHVEIALIKMCYAGRAVQAPQNGASALAPEKKTPDVSPSPRPPQFSVPTGTNGANGMTASAPSAGILPASPHPGNAQRLNPQQMRELESGIRQGLKKAETISLKLDDYETAVVVEEAEIAGRISRLNVENVVQEWQLYAQKLESNLVRMAFAGATLTLIHKNLHVAVRSVIERNHIQGESMRVLDALRRNLHEPVMTISIEVAESKSGITPSAAAQRPKTAKDKLEDIKNSHPFVQELIQRFDLRLEER